MLNFKLSLSGTAGCPKTENRGKTWMCTLTKSSLKPSVVCATTLYCCLCVASWQTAPSDHFAMLRNKDTFFSWLTYFRVLTFISCLEPNAMGFSHQSGNKGESRDYASAVKWAARDTPISFRGTQIWTNSIPFNSFEGGQGCPVQYL